MKLLVVSGLSGSGKSIVLQVLEDRDYYCVDNLPVSLLPGFAGQMENLPNAQGDALVAVGIDARNLVHDLENFSAALDKVRQHGIACEIIFLWADDKILLQRFSETRRRHPLSNRGLPLLEAIIQERRLLAPISQQADLRIDTSRTNVHQLRDLITQRIVDRGDSRLSIQIVSFGYKNGVPADADFVFDARCLPNPYWDPRLRMSTGKDQDVIDFLGQNSDVQAMLDDIWRFLHAWLPRFLRENRSYMTIAIGCTGGQHRSVYLTETLAEKFRQEETHVVLRHRELP